MKRFLLTVFGVHLLFAGVCMMPPDQVEAAAALPMHHMQTMPSQENHSSSHHHTEDPGSSCAGGHCLTVAVPASTVTAASTVGVLPGTDSFSNGTSGLILQSPRSLSPPIRYFGQKTVFRL